MQFERKNRFGDVFNLSMLTMSNFLSAEEQDRLSRMRTSWNFYDGYHWEDMPAQDKPEVTENYCRTYVNKYIAFEFGKGFTIKMHDDMEGKTITEDEKTSSKFLEEVWKDNKKDLFCTELGQMKSITGEAWVQIKFIPPEDINDPYGEYINGRIRVIVAPSIVVFPVFDVHDKEKLEQVTIMYPIEVRETSPILKRISLKKQVYKQVWTEDKVEIWEGTNKILDIPNKYGVIPFIQVKNLAQAGRTEGLGDLEDLIPLNVELNTKKSDISEIIDYHAAPITVVFGAKISSLEKGANKIWGGLPKDSKVENLQLDGDLNASVNYVDGLKTTMSEVAGVPEGALGGSQAISNTSGIALQFSNLPLVEKTKLKKKSSVDGLQRVNKLILLVAEIEGIITLPQDVARKNFFSNTVIIPDNLPKDIIIELQAIEQEMKLGLEDREGAMERLSKSDIKKRLNEIDLDREKFPLLYGLIESKTNSGITNGQTPIEQVRKETSGKNGETNTKTEQ